jgi:hypothetical protein
MLAIVLWSNSVSIPQPLDTRSFELRTAHQSNVSSFLALDADHRPIGTFFVGFSIWRKPRGAANDLNAADRLTARPRSDNFQAIVSENAVAHADCFVFHHLRIFEINTVGHHREGAVAEGSRVKQPKRGN